MIYDLHMFMAYTHLAALLRLSMALVHIYLPYFALQDLLALQQEILQKQWYGSLPRASRSAMAWSKRSTTA